MTDDRSGRELTPHEAGEVDTPDSSLAPVDGERRDVERFSSGPRAHSVGLTEERSAQIVRQSANARNVVFLAILLVALFIPVYWFYESGVPALGTEGRMAAEIETQYVTDVARGYELYLANCAECHGDSGQGGIGPRLNDQGKLYNVLTPAGDPGSGHLNPNYLDNVLTVGGRYVCGDPDSLMAPWKEPDGPLNYRQVEELIAWLTASQDIVFEPHGGSHGEAAEEAAGEPESVAGWRDPDYEPGPEDTPVPACWKAPGGLVPGTVEATQTTTTDETVAPVMGGTPDAPRVINITATSSLQFLGEDDAPLTKIDVLPGETIEFVVDNGAGFDHNFYIGTAEELQVPAGETPVGIPTWQSGQETLVWTVPETGDVPLQFACTVPGHYQPMHGDIVFSSGDTVETSGDAGTGAGAATGGADGEAATSEAAAGAEGPRVVNLTATAALQFLGEDGAPLKLLDVSPGETIEFVVDNTAGFDHNFWIGPATEVSQPLVETDEGIPTWQTGVQTVTWVVPDEIPPDLQFGCTIPGHYAAGMHGDIVISAEAPADGAAAGTAPAADEAPAAEADTGAATADSGEGAAAEPAAGVGTLDAPRVIRLQANAALQFLDENGAQLTSIDAAPGETIEFIIDNTAGFDHNFFIGTAGELQVPFGETDAGIPTWQSGEQSYIWTVPESGTEGLQFACTVPGHYTPMHGDIVISS